MVRLTAIGPVIGVLHPQRTGQDQNQQLNAWDLFSDEREKRNLWEDLW